MSGTAATPILAAVGDRLPAVTLAIDRTRICQSAAATLDWFGGHHDPAYAEAQGIADIYPNVMFIQGMVDRLVYSWGGPSAVIRWRRIDMLLPVLAGREVVIEGTVTSVGGNGTEVGVDVTVTTEDGVCVRAAVTATVEPGAGATGS